MFRIKRLYSFILKTFLPLLLATFSVCLFILLMQFLWKHVEDMVGKGVGISVLGELFFYASLSLIPMTLPLAILLASLMTFGNLGEHLELLAMKASGISLIRIMKPLIVFIIIVMGISFVFQNNVLPPAQAKMYTILMSLRQKSPELDIPEGSFYKDIPGYNVYVRHKEPNGLLKDMMIYDYSKGFDNAEVVVADSGMLKVTDDKKYLILTLMSGESFRNIATNRSNYNRDQIPYMREKFTLKETLIDFDTNFNMKDESVMQNRDISKNIKELRFFVDSVSVENDSVAREIAPYFTGMVYGTAFKQLQSYPKGSAPQVDTLYADNFELLFENSTLDQQLRIIEDAKSKSDRLSSEYLIRMHQQSENQRQIRGHNIELHRKFTYALACLLFFFIGAPLGAIIRKGGLGMPAVLSVIIFLLYYTIDLFGLKMAKQGIWAVWEGMWLSTLPLVILGVFFTYKAVNDSVMMNPDAWKDALQKLIGKREVRNYSRKEVIMETPDYQGDIRLMEEWDARAEKYLSENKEFLFYIAFWKRGFIDKELDYLISSMNIWIEDLQNSDENLIIGKLMDYPVMAPLQLGKLNKPGVRWFCALFFPLGLILYFIGLYKRKQVRQDLETALKVNSDLEKELSNYLDRLSEQEHNNTSDYV